MVLIYIKTKLVEKSFSLVACASYMHLKLSI